MHENMTLTLLDGTYNLKDGDNAVLYQGKAE